MNVKPLSLLALVLITPLMMGATQPRSYRMVALGPANALVVFSSSAPQHSQSINITGIEGTAVSIDVRPADGKLYAITDRDTIYTIDSSSGFATYVSKLSSPFGGGKASGMDFNPQTDRLRLVGPTGQNLRMNVELGAVAIDTPLNYVAGDNYEGKRPRTSATAYTNSLPRARMTTMFSIDTTFNTLVRQDPPNDGALTTVGPLGIDCGETAGFDIFTDAKGVNDAFALCNNMLYSIHLQTGAARLIGPIGTESELQSLAVLAEER